MAETDEAKRLKEKSAKGASNMISDMFNSPEIRKIILKKALPIVIIIFAFFLMVLLFFDAVTQLLDLTWQTELILGAILFLATLICLLKNNIVKVIKNGN